MQRLQRLYVVCKTLKNENICGLHAHLNTLAKFRKCVDKWSSAKIARVDIWTGPMFYMLSESVFLRSLKTHAKFSWLKKLFLFWVLGLNNSEDEISSRAHAGAFLSLKKSYNAAPSQWCCVWLSSQSASLHRRLTIIHYASEERGVSPKCNNISCLVRMRLHN